MVIPVRIVLAGLLFSPFFALTGCGSPEGDPAALAQRITRLSSGQASFRRHEIKAIGIDYASQETMEGLGARHVEVSSTIEGWYVTLDKWVCADPESGERCGPERGFPVTYVIDESKVDVGTIRVDAPDEAKGESGYRVAFACVNDKESCLDAKLGAFGGYKPCKERQCGLAESEVEDAALSFAQTIALLGEQSIECPDRKTCERVAHDFRELIDHAAARTFIDSASEFEKAVARIARAADGAEFAEAPVNGKTLVIAGSELLTGVDRAAYRTKSIRLDPDGRLHVELAVCAEATAKACSDESAWKPKITHVALPAMDGSNVYVHSYGQVTIEGRTTEYEGLAVFAGCRAGGMSCIVNEGIRVGPLELFIPCKDEKTCEAARADFAGMASFASTPDFADWLAAHRDKTQATTKIENVNQAERAARRIGEHFSGAFYEDEFIGYVHPFGAELYEDRFLVVRTEACEQGPDCAAPDGIAKYSWSFDLTGLNSETVRADELLPDGESPNVWTDCVTRDNCILMASEDGEDVSSLDGDLVPCNSLKACRETAEDLRGLIRYASARAINKKPGNGKLGKLARGVSERASGGAYVAAVGEKRRYLMTFDRAWAHGGHLLVSLRSCLLGEGKDCADETLKESGPQTIDYQEIDLSQADGGTIETFIFDAQGDEIDPIEAFFTEEGPKGPDNYTVVIYCKRDALCVSKNGIRAFDFLLAPCPDQAACDEIVGLLKDAAGTAAPKSATDAGAKRAETVAPALDLLRNATGGAEIYLPVSGNDVTRLMRGVDIGLDGSGGLLIHRQVCLALLRAGENRGNECSLDTLFRDYDLAIDLAALDPGSIKPASGAAGKGERGGWIAATCKRSAACASLARPAQPHYRALEFDTLTAGFGETVDAPVIRIPCVGEDACRKAADALRALAKSAKPKEANNTNTLASPGVDPRFVGTWTLSIPQQTGWTWEFRGDGTYVFVNDQTRFQGTYKAGDGAWSQKAVNFSSEDSGTYRFRDADTLELTGNLGTSVWKRRK